MVTLSADEEVECDQPPVGRTGLFTFSGGVDGTFSLLRHHAGHDLGRGRIPPEAALLVAGLDIPQERQDVFDAVAEQAERMLRHTQVPLLRITTNFRQLGQAWEDAYGLGLASCMLLLSGQFAFGVKGGGEPYERLIFPWGSTPLTDPLVRTESFGVVHDGADHDRTEKVEWLVRNAPPGVVERLRVCWEGPSLDRNCGRCEKCVRTALNFWAAGVTDAAPASLPLTRRLVRRVVPRNDIQLAELVSLDEHAATRHPQGDPLRRAVRRAVVRGWVALLARRWVARPLARWPLLRRVRDVARSRGPQPRRKRSPRAAEERNSSGVTAIERSAAERGLAQRRPHPRLPWRRSSTRR